MQENILTFEQKANVGSADPFLVQCVLDVSEPPIISCADLQEVEAIRESSGCL